MDDFVKDQPVDQKDGKGRKPDRWRVRFALGALVLLIILGYGLMFFAIDFWLKK